MYLFFKYIVHDEQGPIAILNIGGVANITYINDEQLIAFDTGPGNALIDDVALRYFALPFDDKGKIAKQGNIDHTIVSKVLTNEYFKKPYPKSLDRNTFSFLIQELAAHNPSDIIATLTFITAYTIAYTIRSLPKTPRKLYLCGGGSNNIQMINWIKELINKEHKICDILSIHTKVGFNPDYIESQAFAYLTARFYQNLPSTFPSTTGASKPGICGCLVKI